MTVRRLFSSCATLLAVLLASSRSAVRFSRSIPVVFCFFLPEPLEAFFRTDALAVEIQSFQ
jgi:hypothetical protein